MKKAEAIRIMVNCAKDYDSSKTLLYTDKLIGNVTACLGFIQRDGFYIPNTALRQDMRDISTRQQKVLAVFRKERKAAQYTELCYIAKGVDLSAPSIQNILVGKVLLP